jgi:hypothetical protein
VPVELRSHGPLADIRVAARPAVLLVNIASVLAGHAMFTNMVATPQLLQQDGDAGYGIGLDVFHAGLWMTPAALAFGATETAAANGLNTILRSVGTSTASATVAALTTTLVVTIGEARHPSFDAFTAVFWIAAAASAMAGAMALPLLKGA